MTRYFNIKSKAYGVETVDEISREDFSSMVEFKNEIKRLKGEYSLIYPNIYVSQRCDNEWKNK